MKKKTPYHILKEYRTREWKKCFEEAKGNLDKAYELYTKMCKKTQSKGK